MEHQKEEHYLLILGILCISICLRAPLTAVGPLIEDIGKDLVVSPSLLGMITTLPVLVFGVTSPFINSFSRKLGYNFTVMIGLVFLVIGILLRSFYGFWGLLFGTILMAFGIGVGNVLLPSIIKSRFGESGGMITGAYMTIQGVFAGIGAGLSLPLAIKLGFGWRITLSVWAIAAVIALLLWVPQVSEKEFQIKNQFLQSQKKLKGNKKNVWASPWAWHITLFLGSQSLLFYSLSNWIPSILADRGLSVEAISMAATWYQWSAVPTTFLAPILIQKMKNKKILAAMIGIGYFIGIVLFLISGTSVVLLLIALAIASASGGANYSLSMTMIVLVSNDAQEAGELSGMSQCAGYLLAALGPVVSGILYDYTGQWTATLLFYLLVTFVLFISGQLVMKHDSL
ncbi:CynX/NimT family MFS transporter [Anaerovorax sp. IOR16]|uniref:CynX/NimT family MFS transporter n=1 Tax=Anaerovorax sp. IOR16 TaxID=2773458 RepID=UPI0019D110C1|nr:MFS transporter [Anaerovorax sp. IOR16]